MMNMPNEETAMVMNLLIVRVNFIKRIMQICSRNVSFLMMKKNEWKDRDDHESIKSDSLPHIAYHWDPF